MKIQEHYSLEWKLENSFPSSVKKIIVAIVVSLVAYGLGYLVQFLLARFLGIKVYGDYAAASGAIGMISSFSLMGVAAGLNKFLPGFIANSDVASAAGFMRYVGKRVTIVNAALLILGVFLVLLIFHFNTTNVLLLGHVHPFYLFLWSVPFFTAICLVISFLKATGHGSISLLVDGIFRPMFTFLILGLLLIFKSTFTVAQAFFILLGAMLLSLVVAMIFAQRKTPIRSFLQATPRYDDAAKWLKETTQLFIFGSAISFYGTFVIIITAIFDSNLHAPGIIAASITIANTLWVLLGAISAIMIPKLATKITLGDNSGVKSIFFTSMIMNFILVIPTFLGLFFWGKQWLAHFGHGFAEGYPVLMIISAAILIDVLVAPLQWVISYSKDIKELMNVAIILFIVFLLLEVLLIHFWGVIGGAIGYAVIRIALCISVLWIGIKKDRFLFTKNTSVTPTA